MKTHRSFVALVALGPLAVGCGSSQASAGGDAGGGPDRAVRVDGGMVKTNHDGRAPGADGTTGMKTHDGGAAGDGGAANEGGGGSDAPVVIGDPTGVTATPVSTFLDSLGVCTHVGQGVDSPGPSATAISFAGFHHIRDDGVASHVNDWISMHMSSGMTMSLLTDQDVTSTTSMAESLNAAGALLAVEGPNEPNNFPVTYEGQTSNYMTTFMPVAALQRDLYAAVKADSKLSGIPVFHSSEAGGSEPDNVGLQFLTIPTGSNIAMPDGTKYADYANTHNYVTGHSQVLSDNIAWNASDPTLNGDWDGPYVEYHITWHEGFMGYSLSDTATLPKVTTETGWTTSGTGSITLEQQARLFLDLYFAAFKEGFSYTFIYMLRDDPVQGYWGLFDTSYNAKTSGTYMHNLTTILADTGTGTPAKLDYSITSSDGGLNADGGTEPATVHDLLLQKKDGTFELVVWDERLTGGSDAVTVDLHKPRATVNLYDPTTGTSATSMKQDVQTLSLTLSDHPQILEIAP